MNNPITRPGEARTFGWSVPLIASPALALQGRKALTIILLLNHIADFDRLRANLLLH